MEKDKSLLEILFEDPKDPSPFHPSVGQMILGGAAVLYFLYSCFTNDYPLQDVAEFLQKLNENHWYVP